MGGMPKTTLPEWLHQKNDQGRREVQEALISWDRYTVGERMRRKMKRKWRRGRREGGGVTRKMCHKREYSSC